MATPTTPTVASLLPASTTPGVPAAITASPTAAGKRSAPSSPEPTGDAGKFAKLRKLDPDAREKDYLLNGVWDADALDEDIRITESYRFDVLESVLQPIRQEIKNLVDATPRFKGPVQVSFGNSPVLILSDADGAKDTEKLKALGVKRIVNCSPQTVKTGAQWYGPSVKYIELWEDDLPDYCIMQDFEGVLDFATNGEGATLLHCEQGINRSGALVIAMCMKFLAAEQPSLPPAEVLRSAWRSVAERRGKVLTNPSFQRQLLLFAHASFNWFPSFLALWRTPKERNMARFRDFAERVASDFIAENSYAVPEQNQWRFVVFIRDGTMRGELNLKQEQFEMSSPFTQDKAERRIRQYAQKSLKKAPEKWV